MPNTFIKYPHVERLGKDEVSGILQSDEVYVFPKLDGSNCCVWSDETGNIQCGSRNRKLAPGKDNAGFMQYITTTTDRSVCELRKFCINNPNLIIYGEWLGTKNKIRNYETVAFWLFDVYDRITERFYPHPYYQNWMEYDYVISPLACSSYPTQEAVSALMEYNHFNLPDDSVGEGIVIKNYSFENRWHKYAIAKMVRDEFKTSTNPTPTSINPEQIESKIIEVFVTDAFLCKTKYKALHIADEDDRTEISGKTISIFLQLCWKDFIEEEWYDIIKKFKNPTVNFKELNAALIVRCKKYINV